ncbi:transcription factor RcaD [Brasilonema octagenarum UFV-E1]|uniref:Transcription factor RcaD n=1 Tax=Brasilonema sennae CENA114 TaxID=415709 RepID=A0A856MGU5_9CYAN|nr:transcription factor RcaD [Brasilonema sennae]QDL08891.1 transcription factor RcaD [Brasilonema sennae CENA114]QDL15248.1 transcription factor RcaD [Brasilonema octagenarum UFV-E1]
MDTNELKFLLKLLGCANYKSSFSASIFDSFKGKDKICQNLGDRELLDYSREIAAVKILPPGNALLKLEATQLPITDKELKVLEKISKAAGKVSPSKIKISSLKAPEKEAILKTLSERGLIDAEIKRQRLKAEVWLTQRGIEYLRDDYNPKGAATISLDLLNNYLRFLRKSLHDKPEQVFPSAHQSEESSPETIVNISDEEILETIRRLDRELGTDNYLPIFYVREKLQPPLSREEVDKALYRLEETDQIELSTLAEPGDYGSEQVDAGIPQISGGSLFFITVI